MNVSQARKHLQTHVASYVIAGRLTAEQARGVLDGSLDANVEAGLLTTEQLREICGFRLHEPALADGETAVRADISQSPRLAR